MAQLPGRCQGPDDITGECKPPPIGNKKWEEPSSRLLPPFSPWTTLRWFLPISHPLSETLCPLQFVDLVSMVTHSTAPSLALLPISFTLTILGLYQPNKLLAFLSRESDLGHSRFASFFLNRCIVFHSCIYKLYLANPLLVDI